MLRDKWLGMSLESTNGTNVNCFENPKAWQEVPGSSCCGCCFRHQKKGRWRIFPPNSVLLGVLNAILRCPPWCWMVCPPSGGSCLPLCLSPSLSLFLFPFVASGIILHFSWWYWMCTSSVKLLARLEAVGSGIENDVTFHFYPPMFSLHPIWHSYAAWFECLDPNTPP